MQNQHCNDCCHYLQHYIFAGNKITRVYCGHCTLQRAKRKHPDAAACVHFSPGTDREAAFVSKEYLSKELLQYMLRLELLPKIEEQKRDDFPGKD